MVLLLKSSTKKKRKMLILRCLKGNSAFINQFIYRYLWCYEKKSHTSPFFTSTTTQQWSSSHGTAISLSKVNIIYNFVLWNLNYFTITKQIIMKVLKIFRLSRTLLVWKTIKFVSLISLVISHFLLLFFNWRFEWNSIGVTEILKNMCLNTC